MNLILYNSLTQQKEPFEPIAPPKVGLYTCGMTVYDYAHIGHGRKYVGDDILRRTLKRFGYDVTHVQNVTDVGHLSSDADSGEDKMEKGASKTGQTVWDVAAHFTDHFYRTMDTLNILRPDVICKATEHVADQIALIGRLMKAGHAYDTPEAVYFDVSTFSGYESIFGRQKLEDKKTAAREAVREGESKRHPADFALWFKRVGRFAHHTMRWDSPWGDGFPGWHIECSAMSMKYLGDQIDIHTGGIDHIPVHHPNEIAQSEGATGKRFVKYWVHHNFLRVDGRKMSKSLGNYYTVDDVMKRGYEPLSLRYLYLTSHYRKELNFTWESLDAAASAFRELRNQAENFRLHAPERHILNEAKLEIVDSLRSRFDEALAADLNMPKALAVVWEAVKASISSQDKYDLLLDFDEVLGFGFGRQGTEPTTTHVPPEVARLLAERETARNAKDFGRADAVRDEVQKLGYVIEDTPNGQVAKPRDSAA